MRDPGLPRRNPFFDHASDPSASSPGPGFRVVDDPEGASRPPAGTDREAGTDRDGQIGEEIGEDAGSDAGGDAFSTLLGVVAALGEAQPEATEHLVAAAHEMVLAVKVVVDATEAVLAEQRTALAARHAEGS